MVGLAFVAGKAAQPCRAAISVKSIAVPKWLEFRSVTDGGNQIPFMAHFHQSPTGHRHGLLGIGYRLIASVVGSQNSKVIC
jgi:hypothetical protein